MTLANSWSPSAAWLLVSGQNNRVEGGPRYFFFGRSSVFLSDRVYEILRSHSRESEFGDRPRDILNV